LWRITSEIHEAVELVSAYMVVAGSWTTGGKLGSISSLAAAVRALCPHRESGKEEMRVTAVGENIA
jgi:hypothetical protein